MSQGSKPWQLFFPSDQNLKSRPLQPADTGSLSLFQVLSLLCSVGSGAVSLLQDLLRVVEAARELLVQERQKKLQLEMRLREEICNEMLEHMQQKEQWWRYNLCWSPSLCSR